MPRILKNFKAQGISQGLNATSEISGIPGMIPDIPEISGIVNALHLSFPGCVFSFCAYCLISEKVFAISGFFGNRLYPAIRNMLFSGYVGVTLLLNIGLHVSITSSCWTTDVCSAKPMRDKWCSVWTSVYLLVAALSAWGDRILGPFLNTSGRARTNNVHQRFQRAAPICTAWLGLAHGDPVSVLLICLLAANRVRTILGRVADVYADLLRLGIVILCILSINGTCEAVDTTVATATILASLLA